MLYFMHPSQLIDYFYTVPLSKKLALEKGYEEMVYKFMLRSFWSLLVTYRIDALLHFIL